MTSRVLQANEWPEKLAGTELEAVWPHLDPDQTRVLVVEDESGTVIGTWALFPMYQVEGLYIDPAHRGKGAVAKRLMDHMAALTSIKGIRRVETGALTDQVRRFLARLGAEEVPGARYVIPTENLSCLQQ